MTDEQLIEHARKLRKELERELPNGVGNTMGALCDALSALPSTQADDEVQEALELHGLDTANRVCFYEQDFYVLSNFSSFEVEWASSGVFKTSEHLYHWLRFVTRDGFHRGELPEVEKVADAVRKARSAHDAFKLAQTNKHLQRPDWDSVKVDMMRKVIRAKAEQHEYVKRKLLDTGDRELVENSWRDDFWGWGPNRDGQNMLGKLWMEIRSELRAALAKVKPNE